MSATTRLTSGSVLLASATVNRRLGNEGLTGRGVNDEGPGIGGCLSRGRRRARWLLLNQMDASTNEPETDAHTWIARVRLLHGDPKIQRSNPALNWQSVCRNRKRGKVKRRQRRRRVRRSMRPVKATSNDESSVGERMKEK